MESRYIRRVYEWAERDSRAKGFTKAARIQSMRDIDTTIDFSAFFFIRTGPGCGHGRISIRTTLACLATCIPFPNPSKRVEACWRKHADPNHIRAAGPLAPAELHEHRVAGVAL